MLGQDIVTGTDATLGCFTQHFLKFQSISEGDEASSTAGMT